MDIASSGTRIVFIMAQAPTVGLVLREALELAHMVAVSQLDVHHQIAFPEAVAREPVLEAHDLEVALTPPQLRDCVAEL